MPFGFRATNQSGQVLVDSDLFHYHFIGQYHPYTVTQIPDMIYGPGYKDYGPNENKGMEGMPDKALIYKFLIPSNGDKPPLCFVKPGSFTFLGIRFRVACGIILTARQGSNWEVWLLQNGFVTANPSLYCFSPLNQISTTPTQSMGLVTYNSSGQKTFDSRFLPLRVVAAGAIDAPLLAHVGSNGSGWTPDLSVNNTEKSSSIPSIDVNDAIFYVPSLAHACQQYEFSASDSGIRGYKTFAWSRADLWWCFYRAVYKLSETSISSNYAVYARGHVYDHKDDSSNILAGILLGALTGGLYFALALGALVASGVFTNAGVAQGGYLPYANGSRNTGSNSYLISYASYYPSVLA